MPDVHVLAIDLAKRSFQVCGTDRGGAVLFNRTVSRAKLIQLLNAHLAEFGLVVAQGPAHLKQIVELLDEAGSQVPDTVREIVQLYLDQIDVLTRKIEELHGRLRDATRENAEMRRLCTVPGVGPVTAGAVLAFAPDLRAFSSGRNFAAWLGLVPKQRSTGGKTRLGGVSKMGHPPHQFMVG